LTKSNCFCKVFTGERYSFKIKYRFQVFVPKRQILPWAIMRIIRSALTCLSVLLTPLFIFPLAYNMGDSYEGVRAAYAHPINAIIGLAFFVTAFLHFFQGIQVVIEDYVYSRWELVLIVTMRLLSALFALIGAFAILKIALAG
jgi:succinate dehydrogenase membrane anchor subunit